MLQTFLAVVDTSNDNPRFTVTHPVWCPKGTLVNVMSHATENPEWPVAYIADEIDNQLSTVKGYDGDTYTSGPALSHERIADSGTMTVYEIVVEVTCESGA